MDSAGVAPVPPVVPGQIKEVDFGPVPRKVIQQWLSLENARTVLKDADVEFGAI